MNDDYLKVGRVGWLKRFSFNPENPESNMSPISNLYQWSKPGHRSPFSINPLTSSQESTVLAAWKPGLYLYVLQSLSVRDPQIHLRSFFSKIWSFLSCSLSSLSVNPVLMESRGIISHILIIGHILYRFWLSVSVLYNPADFSVWIGGLCRTCVHPALSNQQIGHGVIYWQRIYFHKWIICGSAWNGSPLSNRKWL